MGKEFVAAWKPVVQTLKRNKNVDKQMGLGIVLRSEV